MLNSQFGIVAAHLYIIAYNGDEGLRVPWTSCFRKKKHAPPPPPPPTPTQPIPNVGRRERQEGDINIWDTIESSPGGSGPGQTPL